MAGPGVKKWRHLLTWRQGARWRRQTWRQNVASLAHVASGSQVASPGHLPTWRQGPRWRRRTWRHWATWRRGARCRGRTWRQNVASLAHVVSRSQVASPDVVSKCGVREPGGVAGRGVKMWRRGVREPGGVAGRGVKMWRHLPTWRATSGSHVRSPELCQRSREWPHLASQNVASKCGVTCPRDVREPRGVAGRGVKTWRQAPSIYVASQDVASTRGVTKPGLPARVFKMCLQSSGDMCTPTGDHPVKTYYSMCVCI